MNNDKEPKKGKKGRKLGILIYEIVVLAIVVVCYSLPLPWRIIGPLTIGTISILIRTFIYGR